MKKQLGFISTQLYRGIAERCTFINYAVWESSDHYKQAFGRPSNPSLSTLSDFPTNTVSPHLFKKVAMSGICVGLNLAKLVINANYGTLLLFLDYCFCHCRFAL
jgi:hypothetical protein